MIRIIRLLTTLATVVAALLVASAPAAVAAEPGNHLSSKQLSVLVAAVRAETDSGKQGPAAEKIPRLLNEAELSGVDARTLQDLALSTRYIER